MDFVGVLEAAYATAPDDEAWARRVVDSARAFFVPSRFVGMNMIEHAPDCSSARITLAAGDLMERLAGHVQDDPARAFGVDVLHTMYYPPRPVWTFKEMLSALPREAADGIFRTLQPKNAAIRVRDALGMFCHPEPGVAACFYGLEENTVHASVHRRTLLTQVALHIETALRLRRRPSSLLAVLAPDGRILHAEDGAPEHALLTRAVGRLEEARRRATRRQAGALDLWEALVCGQASLVEREDAGRRCYFVVENAPVRQPLRMLTDGEHDVVSYAARGLTSKLVAYALGLSASTVSARLASAARKIGLATRLELVRIAAMLTCDPRARFEQLALTTSERDVLALLAQGLSNEQIAQRRGRSIRTIANQVASLLAKTGAASRRALVASAV
jgi:DNA-binding CsgD family transcriptional regulator